MSSEDYSKLGDLYQLIGVDPSASTNLIETACKLQLQRVHPDKKGGSHDTTVMLNRAMSVLTDEKRRAAYDKARKKLIGNYCVVREIAAGAFGRTYEAEHVLLGVKACLKQNLNVTPEETDMMVHEARMIWRLHHHSLPTLRDFFRMPDGSVVIVMSFVEGKPLSKLIDDHKKMDPEEVCWIMQRLLNALNYMHFHGIIHGDIKPQNIIVQEDIHNAVLVDYGFATARPHRDTSALGYTPGFVAPELMTHSPPTPESDIYSLGCTMIFALGGNPLTKVHAGGIPKEVVSFVDKLVRFNPSERPTWEKMDLVKELSDVRLKAFGRKHSNGDV